jgi:hypothetical protein
MADVISYSMPTKAQKLQVAAESINFSALKNDSRVNCLNNNLGRCSSLFIKFFHICAMLACSQALI